MKFLRMEPITFPTFLAVGHGQWSETSITLSFNRKPLMQETRQKASLELCSTGTIYRTEFT